MRLIGGNMCSGNCSCDSANAELLKIISDIKDVSDEKKANLLKDVRTSETTDATYNKGWEVGYEAGYSQALELVLAVINSR